jgi:hypothetical protein
VTQPGPESAWLPTVAVVLYVCLTHCMRRTFEFVETCRHFLSVNALLVSHVSLQQLQQLSTIECQGQVRSQSTFISPSDFELSATLPSALYVSCMRLGASWVFLVSAGAATWSAASLFILWTGVARPARHSHRNSALVLMFRFIVFQLCAGKRTTWAQSSGSYASPLTHRRCRKTGVAPPWLPHRAGTRKGCEQHA